MRPFTTFRDPHVSRWLSIVDELAARRETPPGSVTAVGAPERGAPHAVTARPRDPGHPALAAAAIVGAEALATGLQAATPPLHPDRVQAVGSGLPTQATECARRAFRLLGAKIEGSQADVRRLEDELKFSECDPLWLKAVAEYLGRFDLEHLHIPYRPAPADPATLPPLKMKDNATVGLVSDWATGTTEAYGVMEQLARHKPDIVIHLGDIYYSGTEFESQGYFFEACNRILGRGLDRSVPVFTLAGNHDMYSGGRGYYALVDALNRPPLAEPGMLQRHSFFGLRSTGWQLLAMDTGLHDHDPLQVNTNVPGLEDSEAAWHRHWIDHAEGRRTILLSHHPLFSAFSAIGNVTGTDHSLNPALLAQFQGHLANVEAWFWGHEHSLAVYGPYRGLKRGRLIGYSAIPTFVSETPYDRLPGVTTPVLPPRLNQQDGVFCHGFVVLKLDDSTRTARASYYQNSDEAPIVYTETINS